MRLLRDRAVQLGDQVRFGHWLAELLEADRAPEYRQAGRPFTVHGTHGGAVPALRCAPGARLRRRSATDRATLLHELGGVEVRADRRGAQITRPSIETVAPYRRTRRPVHEP